MSQPPTTSPDNPATLPDVPTLIQASRPHPHRIGFAFPIMILLLLSIPFLMGLPRESPSLGFLVLIPFAGLIVVNRLLKRFHRSIELERQSVERLEELVQLRQWPQALALATSILSRPMKLEASRLSALAATSSVLIRYHWFESARMIHESLLAEGGQIDPSMRHMIAVARAMTFLREDRLVDADGAMIELRREVNRARDIARRAQSGAGKEIDDQSIREIDSAGLALLELYRDIKTRHYEEAIELFESKTKMMRDQLSVRVADAWALVACAYNARGRTAEAANAFRNATLLASFVELTRRYPEIARLDNVFEPAQFAPG